MKRNCSICLKRVEGDDAPVLAMGAYGNPKVLCDECAAANIDDRVTVATMTEMFESSAKRAQAIKEGTYDFALDEVESDEGFDEIPEELQETEEDRLLDEKEAEANAKLDKFLNWAWVGVAIAVVGFIIYRIFS